MTRRLFFADTETASLTGPVCELAVVEVNENLDIISEFNILLDPITPITPAAQVVHKITDAMVADAPTMAEFIERDGNPFDVEDLWFIAHNAQFDARMLADILPEKYTRICTLKMARKIWPDIAEQGGNHQLPTMALMFGLDAGDSHRALDDVKTTIALVRHMAVVTGASTLDELLDLGRRELSPEDKLGFGAKHKNDKIKDVPISYINWMLKNVTDLDPDIRVAIEARLK
jgi:exodeoxyribonuclease X